MALPVVQRITHFTYWVPAHAHISVLGFSGLAAYGALYFILPAITGRPIHSRGLAVLQYYLVFLGVTGMMVVLTIAGLVQGHAWYHGETVYRVLPEITIYNAIRVMTGTMIATSAYVGLYNVLRSLRKAPPGVQEVRP
jgi:cbb3-type cytochrome oxidase subunit 1